MIVSGIINEKEEKIKAFMNVEINGIQLKGFKLYEDEKQNLRMLYPNYMVKDKDGNYKMNENNKPINKHPITINPELSNAKELYKQLEQILIDTYKECKERGQTQLSKEIEAIDLTKGEQNIITYNINNKKGMTQNPDIQLKSVNTLLIGAFKINEVNLFYNSAKNDFMISSPKYSIVKENESKDYQFVVPKNKEVYAKLKSELITSYKQKYNENKKLIQEQRMQNENKKISQQPIKAKEENKQEKVQTM